MQIKVVSDDADCAPLKVAINRTEENLCPWNFKLNFRTGPRVSAVRILIRDSDRLDSPFENCEDIKNIYVISGVVFNMFM